MTIERESGPWLHLAMDIGAWGPVNEELER